MRFLYDEERVENRGGEKCYCVLLFQREKLLWRRKPRNGVLAREHVNTGGIYQGYTNCEDLNLC